MLTRLVIFAGGIKVDFSFLHTHKLAALTSDALQAGYKVLVDKDGATIALPPPSFSYTRQHKPTREQFTSLVKEFYFEVYHVAKYVKRDDLWLVKFRD